MIERIESFDAFIDIVDRQNYKYEDETEAREFGLKSVKDAYRNMHDKDLAEYYTISDGTSVLATIAVDRCRTVHLFTTTSLVPGNAKTYISDIGKLAKEVANRTTFLLVNVFDFYKQAHKVVTLAGFKPYIVDEYWTTYIIRKTDNGIEA